MARLLLGSSLKKLADRAPLARRVLWAIEAGLVAVPLGLARLLPPAAASRGGRWLLRHIGPRLDKTRKLRGNLALAFPERSPAEIEALVRDNWGNIGATLGEYPHLGAMAHGRHTGRLEIITPGPREDRGADRKPAIFVGAHLSNWEVTAVAMAQLGIPACGIYTPLQNPWLDRMLYRSRKAVGSELVAREGGIRALVKAIGKGYSIGLLVDQRVDAGEPVRFFHHDMLTSVMPARLALRLGCELVPVRVERTAPARFRVTLHPAIAVPDGDLDDDDKALAMTREINSLFEDWIRAQPHEWLCTKRRWAKDAYRVAPARTSGETPL
jgi:KDO2-lipid IV(A) lauroyltransferase